jgi:hypothetical protein
MTRASAVSSRAEGAGKAAVGEEDGLLGSHSSQAPALGAQFCFDRAVPPVER